jgi:serine/threonine-protein kinase
MQETSRWVGRTLRDKWHIDGRISRGGVGTVFAATHRNNGSRVAIKVLHPEFSRDQDTRSRFLQEGYAANQVNHPGVVRILDDDTAEDGSAYLVMELLEGELLERRRMNKGGKLPSPEVYEIADQLLDVLVAAHDKGIVHRDIKPDNLFLTKGGRLKVLDFGFAQMKSGFRKEQTATGYLLGTPGFMSPEQAIGARGQVDAQTDIWAVGATMFTLLSGQPVHDGESAAEMLVAAANFPARSLAQVEPDLPLRLVEIVDRALAFDKTDRWPSARSMQVALRGVPGRQTLGGAGWDSGRRSVPDGYPTVRDVQDERTLAESSMEVEELDASELQSSSWQTADRTVMATNAKIPDEALPSGITRPGGAPSNRHPADEDGRTLSQGPTTDHRRTLASQDARVAPESSDPAPMTPHMAPRAPSTAPPPSIPPAEDGGTLIMDHSQFAAKTMPLGAGTHARVFGPPGGSLAGPGPGPAPPAPAPAFGGDPRASRSEDMMFVAGPARPAPAREKRGGRSALAFIGVALVSMLIVVVTGLLILAAAEP